MNEAYLIAANLLATALMTGVIWIVQLVHYPSFHYIDEARFKSFSAMHQSKITLIVAPLMLIEVVTAAALALKGELIFLIAFIDLLLIWGVTFFVSVPCHKTLLVNGYDQVATNRLVQTNWIRTILWTARLILVGGAVFVF